MPPSPQICDSCSAPLQRNRVYVGYIGQAHPIYVCQACAAAASSRQYVLYQVEQARLIIRQHQARLNRGAVLR